MSSKQQELNRLAKTLPRGGHPLNQPNVPKWKGMTIQANIGIPIEGYFQLFYQSCLAGELTYDEYLLAMQEFKTQLDKYTALDPRKEVRR